MSLASGHIKWRPLIGSPGPARRSIGTFLLVSLTIKTEAPFGCPKGPSPSLTWPRPMTPSTRLIRCVLDVEEGGYQYHNDPTVQRPKAANKRMSYQEHNCAYVPHFPIDLVKRNFQPLGSNSSHGKKRLLHWYFLVNG